MFTKRSLFRILSLVVVAVFALGIFAGCSANNPNPTVLKVGDINVGLNRYYTVFTNYSQMYAMYGLYDASNTESWKSMQENVFDALIAGFLPVDQAIKAGVTLTAEEEAAVQEEIDAEIENTLSGYTVDESITDKDAIRKEQLKLFKKSLKGSGWTPNSYFKYVEEGIRYDAIANKYLESIYAAEVNVTAEDAKAYFEEKLAEQTAAYAEDPAKYYTDYMSYLNSGGLVPLTIPEGYRYVKHILVAFPEEGEEKDVDSILEIVQGYIDDGEDFDSLIAIYNDDPGMTQEPYMSNGYLVSEAIIDSYYEGFGEAAMALENVGDISAPIETEAGYHFIQYASDLPASSAAYEDVEADILAELEEEARKAVLDSYLTKWEEETTIVKYDNRVSSIR